MESLKELVVAEAYALRENATQEELGRLSFARLRPYDYERCIYGQMTGSCFNARAHFLMKACQVPTATATPIETYISALGAKNHVLIEFLRGERETLTIQDL